MTDTPNLLGLDVVVSPMLPIAPSPGEDARRFIRHGYADAGLFPASLGAVGPRPGELTRAFLVGGRTLLVDDKLAAAIRWHVGADPTLEEPRPVEDLPTDFAELAVGSGRASILRTARLALEGETR